MAPVPDEPACEIDRPVLGPWLSWGRHFSFEWNVARLAVPGLPAALAGLRVVHLTDLHLRGHWSRAYDELKRRLEDAPPDLLLVTGDFVDNKRDHSAALPHLHRL